MKKSIVILIISFHIPLFLIILLPSFFIRFRQGISSYHDTQLLPLNSKQPIKIAINTDRNYFSAITLKLKNPLILNNSKVEVDIQGPKSSRNIIFYGSNIGDPSDVYLKFLPFEDLAGSKYQVSITTDNILKDSLYIYVADNNTPIYKTFYNTSNIKHNITSEIKFQFEQFKSRSNIHNLCYIIIIIILSCIYIKNNAKE